MVSRLCATWNTHIVVTTKQGRETSDLIKFNKGLPHRHAVERKEKKCTVTHMKKGGLDPTTSDMRLEESAVIEKDGEQYKFLGLQENLKQEDKLVLNCAAEVYLKRVSVIWSSPLSDHKQDHGHKPVCSAGTGLSNENSELAHCRFATARQRHERSWWRMAESTH